MTECCYMTEVRADPDQTNKPRFIAKKKDIRFICGSRSNTQQHEEEHDLPYKELNIIYYELPR